MTKRCNRIMTLFDDFGDNETTFHCTLPRGHNGPHKDEMTSFEYGKITMVFEKGFVPVRTEQLKHIIPRGRKCISSSGIKCPFLAISKDEDYDYLCYLSNNGRSMYPDEFSKGCEGF